MTGVLVVCTNSISHPEEAWPAISRALTKLSIQVHADHLVFPLWSPQELVLMDAMGKQFLLELRMRSPDSIMKTWQPNWLAMLLDTTTKHRTRIRWYGVEMDRAMRYEGWLLTDVNALVVVGSVERFESMINQAFDLMMPAMRIDADTYEMFRLKRTQPKEERP